MLSLLILLILVWSFYIGYSRGIILQGFYTLGVILSFFVATRFYQKVAEAITLWVPYSNPAEGASVNFFKEVALFDLHYVYYAGVAFCLVFFASYLVMRLLGIFVHFAPIDYFDRTSAHLISGLLGVLVTLIFMSLGFSTLATIPMAFVQNLLYSNPFITFLINSFPILTALIKHFWVSMILK